MPASGSACVSRPFADVRKRTLRTLKKSPLPPPVKRPAALSTALASTRTDCDRLAFRDADGSREAAGVAGQDSLVLAVGNEVQGFEHDGADERVDTIGLDDGAEDLRAPQELELDLTDLGAQPLAIVGVEDDDLFNLRKAKRRDHGRRKYQVGRARVDHARDAGATDALLWYSVVAG